MIECLKIEDFVINEMFRPYATHFVDTYEDFEFRQKQKRIERALRRNPEMIIELLEEINDAKELIFNRLQKFGGVKFYRYLDMSNPVIQYIKKGLEEINENYSRT